MQKKPERVPGAPDKKGCLARGPYQWEDNGEEHVSLAIGGPPDCTRCHDLGETI